MTVTTRHNIRSLGITALVAVAATFAGCAQGGGSNLLPTIGQTAPDAYKPGKPFPLSADELALDCKAITGRMRLRILQARDSSVRTHGSALAQGIQSNVTPLAGGTTHGANSTADAVRDRAYLEAMNRQLSAKNCATFDLDAELQPRSFRDTPTPVPLGAPTGAKAG
jgi:type IV pilus biogenesis protein CpaD/CtpE